MAKSKKEVSDSTIVLNDMDKLENETIAEEAEEKEKLPSLASVNITIIILLLLLILPFAVFGYIIYQASEETNVPILGNRFAGQLNPAITDTMMTTAQNRLSSLDGVESVTVNTLVATTRVTVNLDDDVVDTERFEEIVANIYDTYVEIVPIETYYTSSESVEMYDLDITIYNNLDYIADDEEKPLLMYEINKNSMSENVNKAYLSSPKSADAAADALESVRERDAYYAARDALKALWDTKNDVLYDGATREDLEKAAELMTEVRDADDLAALQEIYDKIDAALPGGEEDSTESSTSAEENNGN